MEQKEKKIYLSNLRPIGNSAGLKGRIYLEKVLEEHIQEDHRGKKFVAYNIWPNKSEDQYGNTHVMVLDTWKPSKEKSENDLPF